MESESLPIRAARTEIRTLPRWRNTRLFQRVTARIATLLLSFAPEPAAAHQRAIELATAHTAADSISSLMSRAEALNVNGMREKEGNCLTQRGKGRKGRKGRKGAKNIPGNCARGSGRLPPNQFLRAFATFASLRQAVRSSRDLHLDPMKPDLNAAHARVQDLGGRRLQRLHM